MNKELQSFIRQWEHETKGTLSLLRSLPPGHYAFRPDEGGRSMGELAWHLAEVDAYVSLGIEQREFKFDVKPANIERPGTEEALAPAFEIVHQDAVVRVKRLETVNLDEDIRYADGTTWTISDLLWRKLLLHSIHHRGQLALLCRRTRHRSGTLWKNPGTIKGPSLSVYRWQRRLWPRSCLK